MTRATTIHVASVVHVLPPLWAHNRETLPCQAGIVAGMASNSDDTLWVTVMPVASPPYTRKVTADEVHRPADCWRGYQ